LNERLVWAVDAARLDFVEVLPKPLDQFLLSELSHFALQLCQREMDHVMVVYLFRSQLLAKA